MGKHQRAMEIHSFRMGPFTNSYLIRGDRGCVLVDAGFPNQEKRFLRQVGRLGFQPGEIRLIVATHGHADHVGSLHALKSLTGARVAVHRQDSRLVSQGIVRIPPPVTLWGEFLFLVFSIFSFLGRFHPVEPDIVLDDEYCLDPFGIPGKIIHTSGHTPGSVSLVLAGGEAFVGDLAVNTSPLGRVPGIPALAEDTRQIYKSWERLLSAGARTIYPAHGKPFPSRHLERKPGSEKPRNP